eukprot:CAMPEP_0172440342 /NCGR_PEP_ID=MMETSP1065-20121228/988_1 /TAXON_ID=265537 /ORGANISM="Amphiprora paludosa, Strain CCMP125" /LENGTH=1147 /DNA_ID=CAMNT_0013189131 /DNA_START=110 /DNA_END=3553 /DNA_ORIENTATION=-
MTDISEAIIQQSDGKDGASVSSQQTGGTQTRFSFYNAEEFQPPPEDITAPSSPEKKESGSNRDSVEILRSLQEHEQQRLEILGGKENPGTHNDEKETSYAMDARNNANSEVSNAYEDAIKEALDLLRKHRPTTGSQANTPAASNLAGTTPRLSTKSQSQQQWFDSLVSGSRTPSQVDPILQSRGEMAFFPETNKQDAGAYGHSGSNSENEQPTTPSAVALGEAYQAEIEARRKQRQERMARYASRLAELKQEDKYMSLSATTNAASSSDVGQPSWGTPRLDPSATWRPTPTDPAPTSRSVPTGFTELNGTAAAPSQAGSVSSVSKDDEVQRGVERVLLAILERAHSHGRGPREGEAPAAQWTSGTNPEEKKATSPEQSRPAEDTGDSNAIARAMTDLLGGPSTSTLGSSSPNRNAMQHIADGSAPQPTTETSKADQEIQPSSSNVSNKKGALTVDTSFQGGAPRDKSPEDDLDRMVRTVLIQETNESSAKHEDSFDQRVRNVITGSPDAEQKPVPQGEDTSVEDEEGEEIDPAEVDDDELPYEEEGEPKQDLDGVLGPLSQNAGGTTGVVLEPDSPVKEEMTSPSLLDSLSAAVSMVAGTLVTSDNSDKYSYSEVDEETNELMRTLCAHLLPASAVQSSKVIQKRPDWDESNPDEAGYRIIRLTTAQLSSVEYAFERVMEMIKNDKNNDDAFERDLKAAEDLLDQDERKHKGRKDDMDADIEAIAKIYPEQQPLDAFPGVKSTGRGEMGDLEYFHLPIIFKSHVTGFEPTKDLVLESGNVVAGQYLVEGELGTAAFSTAYRCVDLNSDGDGPDGHDEVCLKVIKNTKDFFDQSLDEIKILELLRQTGMCQEKSLIEMKTFFYHREHLIIVTELLRQNLFEFGKFIIDSDEEPYFTMPRLCYLTRQMLVAMDFVHKLGLVHSDIKPENILLSSYSRAKCKIIDFGSSCFLTDRQSSYIQSRSYRAPEVILGLPYDGRIDIWSLGCVVAEMYTGEVTFQNDSIVSMLSRIEAICGAFPPHMIAQGRQSGRFFMRCGLLFEKLSGDDSSHHSESDEEDESSDKKRYVDVFQPKVTTISSRLGFAPDLMMRYDSGTKLSREENRQAIFVDFVRKLLIIDPEKRPTASEALEHPWMKYAESLTEEEIKYPSF